MHCNAKWFARAQRLKKSSGTALVAEQTESTSWI